MKRIRRFLCLTVAFCILGVLPAFAGTVITAAETPLDGCMICRVDGTFVYQTQAAVDRINAIRKEACEEGVLNPSSGAALTMADYVPVKWSTDLEYIAKVRAAEASICPAHFRPNGTICFMVEAPGGVSSYGESLAWNGSSGMLMGIEQWYGEKSDWVNQTGNETGHYTSMIDPVNIRVGLGCFLNKNSRWYNTTSAEFSWEASGEETKRTGTEEGSVIFDVEFDALTGPSVIALEENREPETTYDKGDHLVLGLGMTATFYGSVSHLWIPGTVSWTSSVPGVASVIKNGDQLNVTVTGTGTTVLTGTVASGKSASFTLTSAHSFGSWTTVSAPTVLKTGSREQVCGICGEKKTETMAKLTPVLKAAKNKVTVKKTKKAKVKVSVAKGDSVKVTSSNNKIATGTWKDGVLTISAKKKAGKAKLTLKTETNLKAEIVVTVPKTVTTKITCKAVKVKKGKKVTLKPKVKPSYSDDKITYKVKNSKIASVSKKGVVKGKKKGTTYVTIKSGKKSVKVRITVK